MGVGVNSMILKNKKEMGSGNISAYGMRLEEELILRG
jgi:hypothetical protein